MTMMAGLQLEGEAASGYGVRLVGFHSNNANFAKKLDEVCQKEKELSLFSQCENNGYVTFIACSQDSPRTVADTHVASLRREPHKLFVDLGTFLRQLKARHILQLELSGSLGALTLTVFYQKADDDA